MKLTYGSVRHVLLLSISAFPLRSSAIVTLEDDPNFGPDSIIRDVNNARDYLRLDFTYPYTYNEVAARLGPGGAFEGWSIASMTDMFQLRDSAGIGPSPLFLPDPPYVVHNADPAQILLADTLGHWFSPVYANRGLISDTTIIDIGLGPQTVQLAFTIGVNTFTTPQSAWFEGSGWYYPDGKIGPGEGIYLTRAASVPDSAGRWNLLLSGIGVLLFRKFAAAKPA